MKQRLNQKVKYIEFCAKYQEKLFKNLLDRLVSKRNELQGKLLKYKSTLINGRNKLMMIIFKFNTRVPTDNEISRASGHKLYVLYDTYYNVLESLLKIV